MKPKIVDGPNQSKRGEEFSALAKIFAIGIAPRGIIAADGPCKYWSGIHGLSEHWLRRHGSY